jgi:hypothetical protein
MRAIPFLALVACAPTQMQVEDIGRSYPRCATEVDIDTENAAAAKEATAVRHAHGMAFDAIIVPGYTPAQNAKDGLHGYAKERLLRAVIDWRRGLAPFLVLTGAGGEAVGMKRYLVAGGIPEKRIFIDPCARHSHTNLRNSGRVLLSNGLVRALIVTSYDQAFYFSTGWLTGFTARCIKQLGHTVGSLRRYDAQRVTFIPSRQDFEAGSDDVDP